MHMIFYAVDAIYMDFMISSYFVNDPVKFKFEVFGYDWLTIFRCPDKVYP